jgi:hypothetical protein
VNGRQRILPMRVLVRILLGGCGAMVRFVGAGLLRTFFYSGELSTGDLPPTIFLRRSSSGDLPPAIFVTGTRSHNLHLTA